MAQVKRRVSFIILLALLTSTTILFAQDEESFTVVGSGIVNPVVEALAEANNTDTISIETTGTSAGFEQFCSENADVVTATRSISADEDANCISNEINFAELLIAHDILGFAVHPTVDFLQCLSINDLNTLFAPSSTGQRVDWSGYSETGAELPLTLIVPQDSSVEYLILDSLVEGDGIRRDVTAVTDAETALATVGETEGAIAVVKFNPTLAETNSVTFVDINVGGTTGCASPSVQNVENRLYGASQAMYVYVNRASLEKNSELQAFFDFIVSLESSDIIATAGYVPPSDESISINQEVLANAEAGRQFTGAESEFEIPTNLAGQITVGGAANAYSLMNTMSTRLTGANQNVVINLNIEGQSAGVRRLCSGELDILIVENDLPDGALDGCEANNINTVPVSIGTQATVLVSNAGDSYATCLTTSQINTIWGAEATETIMNWSDVDSAFPDQAMTLFGLRSLNEYSDILLSQTDGPILPIRLDTEQNNDALYRAAATANVEGALTFMSWTDYQRVLANSQQNIQLVGVDAGAGCVVPSEATIVNGSYPLIRTAQLIVREFSLTGAAVQSYLWTIFSDENFSVLQNEGYVGIDFGDLPAIRSELETQFSLAETNLAASVQEEAEATAEPSTEATEEPEIEATEEAESED